VPDVCLFCPKAADSLEDVFSTWFTTEFTEFEGDLMPVTRTVGSKEKTWQNWTLAFLKIRAVCRKCNYTWMSDWEGVVKPLFTEMIRGRDINLTEVNQLNIATWATLKAYVYDSAGNFPSLVTRSECEVLKTQSRPPGNVRVFLAAHAPGNVFGITRWYATGTKAGDPLGHQAHATTMVLGHLVIQVLGNPRSDYRPFEFVGEAHDSSQTIDPPIVGGSIWPPKYLLDDAALDQFSKQLLVAPEWIDLDDPDDPRIQRPPP
jgi:hypothetical protein